MNIAIVQGRPTRNPELHRGRKSGAVFCTFSIACERAYRGKNQPRETDFFKVVCFGKLAQTVYNNLGQGALCTVEGNLEQDKWQTDDGSRRETVQIKATRITIHEWLRKGRNQSTLDEEFDAEALVPDEIRNSLFKQIDFSDEDIPDDLAGDSIDDLL